MSRHRRKYYSSPTYRTKSKQVDVNRLEHFYYELKPFLCILTSIYFMKSSNLQSFGQVSAILLLLAGTMILFERAKYRGFLK